jgi:hypothetical protein
MTLLFEAGLKLKASEESWTHTILLRFTGLEALTRLRPYLPLLRNYLYASYY